MLEETPSCVESRPEGAPCASVYYGQCVSNMFNVCDAMCNV